jgi:hypothetical protein
MTPDEVESYRRTLELSLARAAQVYDILARECGAPEHLRATFLVRASDRDAELSLARLGQYGFGGKLMNNQITTSYLKAIPGLVYVDVTGSPSAEQLRRAEAANEQLSRLFTISDGPRSRTSSLSERCI